MLEVFAAARNRDMLLGALQSAARKRLGLQITSERLAGAAGGCGGSKHVGGCECVTLQNMEGFNMHCPCQSPLFPPAHHTNTQLLWAACSEPAAMLYPMLAVDGAAVTTADELLASTASAERALSSELPLGQWHVERLMHDAGVLPPQAAQALPQLSGRRVGLEALAAMGSVSGAMGGEWRVQSHGRRAVVTVCEHMGCWGRNSGSTLRLALFAWTARW